MTTPTLYFSVTEYPNPSGSISYRVTGTGPRAGRLRKNFADRASADAYCNQKNAEELGAAGAGVSIVQTRLKPDEVAAAEAGVTRAAGRWQLAAIIDAGIRQLEATPISAKLADLRTEYLALAKSDLSARWYNDVRVRTGYFVADNAEMMTGQLTRAAFAKWLDGLDLAKNTKANYRNALHLWGAWMVTRGYYTENPFGGLRITKKKTADQKTEMPAVLSAIQAEAYLRACCSAECRRLLGWATLCLLCGLRPENEAPALTWAEVNFESGEIHVRGTKKGVKPRYFKPQPMAMEWLKVVKADRCKTPACLTTYQQITGHRRRAVEMANAWLAEHHPDESPIVWIEDIQRHTYASQRQGQGAAIDTLADEMGTSSETIYGHYKHPRPAAEVNAFWQLTAARLMRVPG
jgi:integrase